MHERTIPRPAGGPLDAVPPRSGARRSPGAAGFLGLAAVLLAAGCSGSSQVQKTALDQDVSRDVSWELRKDDRFAEVNASCTGGIVTLRGRVDSRAVESDALRVAQSRAQGARVVSQLEIRPR